MGRCPAGLGAAGLMILSKRGYGRLQLPAVAPRKYSFSTTRLLSRSIRFEGSNTSLLGLDHITSGLEDTIGR